MYTTNPYSMKSVNRKVPFECTKCPKHYWTKYALKVHTNLSHDKFKRHRCYFCSLAIFEESQLIRHMSKHTKEKPLICYFCQKDFSDSNYLSVHTRRVHTKENPFQCRQCPSRYYSRKRALAHHIRIKHGIRVHE
jgi:uncharacterized Zn-finger protein